MPVNSFLPDDLLSRTFSFSNQSIMVVGADTDLGAAISLHLARTDASLILQTARQRQVNALYDQILELPGRSNRDEPLIAEINLEKASAENIKTLAAGLGEQVARLDGIVYLPAPSTPQSPIPHTDEKQIENALLQGVFQPLRLIREMIPLLLKSRHPAVLFQSLAAGRHGKAYWGASGVASAALENLAQTLAAEYESIMFNTLDFGKTASALRHRAYPAEARSTLRECDDPLLLNAVSLLLTPKAGSGKQFALPDRNTN